MSLSLKAGIVTVIILVQFQQPIAKKFVDRVCILSKDVGKKCKDGKPGGEKLYYFDKEKERCLPFDYLGCEGNQNKFGASDDCIDSCQVPYLLKKEKAEDAKQAAGGDAHEKSDCKLKPVPGPCKALITMWYYDTGTSACGTFGYGGCNGNGNKFDTRLECETFCGDNPSNTNTTEKPGALIL